MSKILHLTLTKPFFKMIASGEKKAEYRNVTKYWQARLCNNNYNILDGFKEFDVIRFKNGYSNDCPVMEVECLGIDVGEGLSSWGAISGKEYFIIELGTILSIKNYNPS